MIFKTIKEAELFRKNYEKQMIDSGCKVIMMVDHDQYFTVKESIPDQQGVIIIATNLGGRGTDFEIKNEEILKHGGMHVMMTYFASNWRIEEQAFGRAGRNGQPGSGSFYI
jgi:preprotein translocase subunit SecA